MDLIILYYFHGSISKHGEKAFEEHNQMVRDLARDQGREFLEFEVKDGWELLCKFLGKEIPGKTFPHVNDRESWRASFGLGVHRLKSFWIQVWIGLVLAFGFLIMYVTRR